MMGRVFAYALGILVLLGVIWALIRAVTAKDRYAEMTEEEFEAEAKKVSAMGAGLQEFQRIVEGRRVEYMLQQDKHVEADEADSGDKPRPGPK
jgi:hypothetical protein